jgi:hypothetical protein
MADMRKPTGAVPQQAGQVARDPRATLSAPFRYKYQSIIDFVETQSINISRSGMFVSSNEPLPAVGTLIDFEFALADGFPLLRGKAEVVRLSTRPPGMGLRFRQIDDSSRKLLDRIIEVNTQENKRPSVALDFLETRDASPRSSQAMRSFKAASDVGSGVEFNGRSLRLEINPSTASYFTNNPLLNIRLGGFVVPGPDEVALGTMFEVNLEDVQHAPLWSGKGKVVAKHESRLGIRLADVPKDVLARLQAEITKMSVASK